jgi:hypothetical protein
MGQVSISSSRITDGSLLIPTALSMDVRQLEESRAGRATLLTDVIDRLVELLELRLTPAGRN